MSDRIQIACNQFEFFKDKELRQQQLDSLNYIQDSHKKITVLEAATGIGKSFIGATALAVSGGGIYLCHSKSLQYQLQEEFPEFAILYGRNNYNCLNIAGHTCSDCIHDKNNPCVYRRDCPYQVAKNKALASRYKVLNYSYFLYECNFAGAFSDKYQTVFLDEADQIDHILPGFVSLRVSGSIMMETGIGLPHRKTIQAKDGMEKWIEWANRLEGKVVGLKRELDAKMNLDRIKDINDPIKIKKAKKYVSLITQIKIFKGSIGSGWIMEEEKKRWGSGSKMPNALLFRPVWMSGNLSNMYLFNHGGKFILSSATLPPLPIIAKTIGQSPGSINMMSMGSPFDIKNRPIYTTNCADLRAKSIDDELPKAAKSVDKILEKFKDHKGIIHTVSYKVAKFIMENCNSDRLITHDSKNRDEIISEFKLSDKPLVLVSPSLERGISLKGDLARFSIIVKAPYLYLGSKLVSARKNSGGIGNMWYVSDCAQSIVQAAGRVVRDFDDWGFTFVLDYSSRRLLMDNKELFNKEFLQARKVMNIDRALDSIDLSEYEEGEKCKRVEKFKEVAGEVTEMFGKK